MKYHSRIVITTLLLLFGALLPVSGQVNDSLLIFQGKLETVKREHVEIPDRLFPEYFNNYALVTLTFRIDKVLSGDIEWRLS